MLALLWLATPLADQDAPPAGYTSLFDGKTLTGWRGDSTIWSVRDGAITGGSDTDIPANTFLIFERPYGDFELQFKYRMNGDGNSGIQFRSSVRDEARFSVRGLQVNVAPISQTERFGMLWEEGGRGELALVGHKMVIDPKGPDGREVKHVPSSVNPREKLYSIVRPFPEWNDVVVIVHGNHMVHAINGYLVFDAIDNDPDTPRTGVLAIQTHSGPPMHVQFRDLWIKPLTSFPDIAGRFVTEPGAPTPVEPGPRVPRGQ
jgi:hypothetical protein